ncbi:hypothetical protein KY290_007394 [Solanum tuberosum]|uniref:Uncharacterized protein n=1 Tax=Solanum tuberosum TaxID=4113 RepID=A0ABQ7W5K3_SOLTU|nr:hypothetical protein KY290_007394 [Solanum tuberosum]
MDLENETTGKVRSEEVHIRYDYIPSYCDECKMQGHTIQECRIHNKQKVHVVETAKLMEKNIVQQQPRMHQQVQQFQKGKAKILSSGKVVGDPGA